MRAAAATHTPHKSAVPQPPRAHTNFGGPQVLDKLLPPPRAVTPPPPIAGPAPNDTFYFIPSEFFSSPPHHLPQVVPAIQVKV
jgi:hypothetical protein